MGWIEMTPRLCSPPFSGHYLYNGLKELAFDKSSVLQPRGETVSDRKTSEKDTNKVELATKFFTKLL